jgi:predicted GH43/DUF377 family glycosyl hydrolase
VKKLKLGAAILFLTTIVGLLFPVPASILAATYNLVKSASPVLSSGNFAGNETVIYDSSDSLYKMWYVQTTPSDAIRSYLYSLLPSGLINDLKTGNWGNIAASTSDSTAIQSVFAELAGLTTTQITASLGSITTDLEYATSPDGVTWTNGGTITFPTSTWDQFISSPDVIKDGSTYKMWYTGYTVDAADLQSLLVALNTAAASITPANMSVLLGDIVSGNIAQLRSDLISFSLKSDVTSVLAEALSFAADSEPAIGYATSPDGITWTQDASNPVMVSNTASSWDNLGIMTPAVIKNGTTYQMWYTGISVGINLVTDLLSATSVSSIQTAITDDVNIAIGHATSADGMTWTKDAGPVLQKGATTDWDSYCVFAPSVVMEANGSYDMWYTGGQINLSTLFSYLQNTITLSNFFLTGFNTAIGHATSTNGTTWTKDTASNPVLSEGAGSAWDNYGVAFPSVVTNATEIQLWYTGITISPSAALSSFLNGSNLTAILGAGSGTSTKIGYASATIPVTTTPPSGGGGGGGAVISGPSTVAGVTNFPTAVNAQGVLTQDVDAWSNDNNVLLYIPAGTAVLTSSGAPLSQISVTPMTTPPAVPTGAGIIGLAYDFEPSGITFNPAATIRFSYNPASLPTGVSPSSLQIAYYNSSTSSWVTLTTTEVDTANHFIYAQISHFTTYALTYGNVTVAQAPTTTTTTSVTTTLASTVTTTSAITPTTTSIPTTSPVTTALTTTTPSSVTTVTPVVTPLPAAFQASDLTISPPTVKPGGNINVSLNITNTGKSTGTDIVELKINNLIVSSQGITLAAGGSTTVYFNATSQSSGNYEIEVAGLIGHFTVSKQAVPPWLWFAAIGAFAVGVIIASVFVLAMGRKK